MQMNIANISFPVTRIAMIFIGFILKIKDSHWVSISNVCGRDLWNLVDDPSANNSDEVVPLLESLASEFAHALVPQRILLTVTSGEKFEALAKRYLHRGLKRNIPSLFVDVKPLYKDHFKRDTIQRIVEDYRTTLESKGTTKSDGTSVPTAADVTW